MKIDLVSNPAAGGGRDGEQLIELLLDAGHTVRQRSTSEDWRSLLQDPGDLLVAVGGDGTVRDVALAAADERLPFAIVPFGTANNVAKTLGLVGSAQDLVESWSDEAARRPFDIGHVRAPWGATRLVESIGGGVFAELIAQEDSIGSGAALVSRETDQALYLLGELLRAAEPRPWQIRADDVDCSGEYLAVELLNIRFAGPNVPLAPEATVSDGLLDLVTISAADREGVMAYLDDRLRLASGRLRPLRTVRARRIRLLPPVGTRLRVDDGLWPGGAPVDAPGWIEVDCVANATTLVGRPAVTLSGSSSTSPRARPADAVLAARPNR